MDRPIPDGSRLLVVSPHLDDAIFSCGRMLASRAGSTVVTVLAGVPKRGDMLTDWDRRCGFTSAPEAVSARRDEDRAAMEAVGAGPVWLDFCDAQYDEPAPVDRIAAVIAERLSSHADHLWLMPLGLFHADHLLTHAATVQAIALVMASGQWSSAEPTVLAYEDAPYRSMPGVLQRRLAALAMVGVTATPVELTSTAQLDVKRLAVAAYASQVPMFETHGLDDLWRPERLWHLTGGPFHEAEASR